MKRKAIKKKMTGVFVPMPTIFTASDEVDLGAMRKHVRWLIAKGIKEGQGMIFAGGAMGEFPTLTLEERKRIATALCEEAAGRAPILIGAQGTSTREVIELARHAANAGVTGLQVSPPFYYSPTDDDVYEYMKAIADAADIALILYQTYEQGYRLSMALIEKLARLDQMVGLKWSSPSSYEYEQGYRLFRDRLAIIDNQFHPVYSHIMGARFINLHPANFWPEWGIGLWNLLESHRYTEAQAEVERIIWPYYELSAKAASFTCGGGNLDKLCMELVGLPGGGTRPPMRPLPPDFKEMIRRFFVKAGVPMSVDA
ncbi:MAG: dihydrodipicolinate synthase family protein [Verrucomicrobia bacterium]|nr:dihydrodipicolinate synthase family protein [Verrucomicrobiota bacterium]